MNAQRPIPDSIRRLFVEGFRVADIAEPLASFDETADAKAVAEFMDAAGFDVVGVRRNGRIGGIVERAQLTSTAIIDVVQAVDPRTVLQASAPLACVVNVLASESHVFVSAFGEIAGVVTKNDMEKPPVRMWLFGMVTMIELRYGRLIDVHCPNEAWRQYLSEGRLQKAEELQTERQRRGQSVSLLDCLQLADKGQIVARNDTIRDETIFASRNQAEEGIKMLQALRNNLAHAQEIVATDWETIVRLSRELDRLLNATSTPTRKDSR